MDFLNPLINAGIQMATALILFLQSLLGGLSTQVVYVPTTPINIQTSQHSTTTTAITAHATTSSSLTKTSISTKKNTAPLLPKTTTTTPTTPQPATTVTIDPEIVNTQTRASVVNILCSTQASGSLRPISASGIIVDTRGVILTNAHVGQFLLLKDYPTPDSVHCVIRTGSPAQPQYRVALLYLPPEWINTNAPQIKAEQALGTGEGDYAFLLITSSTNANTPLPSSFQSLPMTNAEPTVGLAVLLAAYPAGFLDGNSIEKNLYSTSALTTVKNLFTFQDPMHVDLVSVPGTIVSQGGSSGGAVVRQNDGKLLAIIATDTSATTTAERDLRAITLSYIDRDLYVAGRGGIVGLLSEDLIGAANAFATSTAPYERKKLLEVLQGH